MDGSLLLWMGLALTVFWSVGVYNRLMRMRARGLSALGSVEKHMRLFAELVQEAMPQSPVNDPQKPGSSNAPSVDGWTRLQAAWQLVDQAERHQIQQCVGCRAIGASGPGLCGIAGRLAAIERRATGSSGTGGANRHAHAVGGRSTACGYRARRFQPDIDPVQRGVGPVSRAPGCGIHGFPTRRPTLRT